MATKRLAGGSDNLKALTEFVSSLGAEDIRATDLALERIQLRDSGFGRGYQKALIGMKTSMLEKNVDSLIYKSLKGTMSAKQRREILNDFRARRKAPFTSDEEKGFHAAWKDVLRIIETMKS